MNNSTSYGVIKIILQKAGSFDDVLTITPNDHDDNYTISFTQTTINNVAQRTVKECDITNYIERFIRTAIIDEVGPDYFQVDVPSYPSVIVKRSNMPSYLPLLFKQIRELEYNWPLECLHKHSSASNKPLNTHLTFDNYDLSY